MEVSARLLSQLLRLDNRQQRRLEVCLEVLLLLQQVDYLVHLLLRHQHLGNLLQHLRLSLEPLLLKRREVCSVRLQRLPPLLVLQLLHLELLQRLQLEVCSEVQHQLRREDYSELLLRRQPVVCLARLRLLLRQEVYLVRRHLLRLVGYLVRLLLRREDCLVQLQRLLQLVGYLVHQHQHLLVDYLELPLHLLDLGVSSVHPPQLVDYLVRLHPLQLADFLEVPLLLQLVDYLVHQPLLQSVGYSERPHPLQLVGYLAHLWLQPQ